MATRSSTVPQEPIASLLRSIRTSLAHLSVLMAAARQVPHSAPPSGLHRLTPCERRVIRLIADPHEWKYPVIAEKLHIHPRTLDGHRRKACRKLGVRSRSGLVRMAVLWGSG